jgi:hypothetical protein
MTDWTPFTPPSGAPSGLQCVTTWRGPVAGTGPLGVFWAGTDGTLWRSSTDLDGDFAPMESNTIVVTRIAVDDRETIYGINSAGKPVQYGNDGWTSLDLGDHSEQYVMIDVAVAKDDTVWFVAREGQYYIHGTIQAPDSSGSNSVGQAWGVIGWGGLALSGGNAWVFNDGTNNMISDVADVKASVNYAWLLKTDGSVWATTTGYTGQRVGTLTAKSICGGQADHCFAVGTDGKPYRTTNSTPLA